MQDIQPPQHLVVRFSGNAKEYFGIWIVNLLLSIVTIGIYSAWAKVRTNKYFYQNTEIGGRRFDYHATGGQILIGRVIVVVALILFQVLATIPVLLLILTLVFLVVSPMLIVRSLTFNARVTSFANVRFNFDGTARPAFLAYILYPFLTVFTLYLAWPFADRARRRYVMNNHLLGRLRFQFDSLIGPFYMAFLAGVGVVIAVLLIVGAMNGGAMMNAFAAMEHGGSDEQFVSMMMVMVRLYITAIAAFIVGGLVYAGIMRNVVFNGTTLEGGHSLRSDVPLGQYVWIGLSNAFVILVTLGLMLPWAKVRMARFLAAHTGVSVVGGLDGLLGDVTPQGGALGDAFTDLQAIELGLPV